MVRLISSRESQAGCLTDCFYNTDDDGDCDDDVYDENGDDGDDSLGKTWRWSQEPSNQAQRQNHRE